MLRTILNIFLILNVMICSVNGCFGSLGGQSACCAAPSCPPAAIPCGGVYGGSLYSAPTYASAGK